MSEDLTVALMALAGVLVGVIASAWINLRTIRTQIRIADEARSAERQEAKDTYEQVVLRDYYDKMDDFLLAIRQGSSSVDEDLVVDSKVAMLARARTLTVLRTLDPVRVGSVLRFLREAKLTEAVPLTDGDLRDVDWHGANLYQAKLRKVYLGGANLSGADLRGADLRGTRLRGARLHRAILRGADLGKSLLNFADLSEADLRGANLEGARYDDDTIRPGDFDPLGAGAILEED